MKKIFFVGLALFLAGCGAKDNKPLTSTVFIEKQLDAFVAANPDWAKDEANEKATTDKFQHEVIRWTNEPDFLADMPLEMTEVKDTLFSEQPYKIAVFRAYNDTARTANSILNYTQLEIDALASDAQLKELAVGKKYTISGNLYKQGKRGDVKYIHVADFKGYDLGKYLFQLTGYKEK